MINPSVVELPIPCVTVDEVLKEIGMSDKAPAGSVMHGLISDIVEDTLTKLVKPVAIIGSAPISLHPPYIEIAHNSVYIECETSLFAEATQIIMAMFTIGDGCESAMAEMSASGDPFTAMIIDTVGNRAILAAFERLRVHLCERLTNCPWVGTFVEPGTNGMSLEVQRVCFSLLNASRIGIELTDSLLMLPTKSFSLMLPYKV